mgnify:CR=1 FL=1
MLRIDQVRPGRLQPRTTMSEAALEELKASIKKSGVIAPVIVRPITHGTYELAAGERRGLRIYDVAPTLLGLYGIEPPAGMIGRGLGRG